MAGDRLVLSVERGDHIVHSLEEISRSKAETNHVKVNKEGRHLTGKAYFKDAMKGHGLPGKIPTSFTTCGKPYVENIQYNSPIEIYDNKTVDEMVKVMDTKTGATTNIGVSTFKMSQQTPRNIVSRMGWTVNSSKQIKMENKISVN